MGEQTGRHTAKIWFLISFGYLVLVALMGVFLRFYFLHPISPIPFDYLLHAHSHLGMLGWVYSALFTGLLLAFHPQGIKQKRYKILFWFVQIANTGMLVTFLMQGYGAFSIAFSTLHILLSYGFIAAFVRDTHPLLKHFPEAKAYALKFTYAGLFFLFLSSFGPWGLAIISANGLQNTNLYDQAIYFYLHFQYNGWFLLSVIGLWMALFADKQDWLQPKPLASAFHLLSWTMIPGYALSLLGFEVPPLILWIALITALLQLAGSFRLYAGFRFVPFFGGSNFPAVVKSLTSIVIGSFFLKWVFQLVGALPVSHELSYQTREVVIGYLHLNMLGIATCGLFYWFYKHQLLRLDNMTGQIGLWAFLFGFILSEGLLLGQGFFTHDFGTGIPYFQQWTLAMQTLMFVGFGMMGTGEAMSKPQPNRLKL